jgi:EmrB/QacA subfamily drug resistance transporter
VDDAGAAAAPGLADRHGPSRWTIAGVVALGSVSSLLSSTVVNVAVADLERVFHASLTDVQWVLTAYLLGLSATIPLSGWATDRFGSKRVYLLTLGTFTVASVLCGLAWSIQSEIAFRVLQGLAGGMIMPVGMAILMRMTPVQERGRMMSLLGVPMMLGPALGPTLGGVVIQLFDWRGIFWINVPVGLLALALAWWKMTESRAAEPGGFDWIGWVTVSPGVALTIYGLTRSVESGWLSPATLLPLGAAAALLTGFAVWELRQERPLLDLRIFGNGPYRAAISVSAVVAASLFGPTFLVPVFMQQVQGYSVLSAGLVVGAQGLGAAIVMPVSGWLTDRYGARPVVTGGVLCLTGATLLLTGVDEHTTALQWALVLAVRGAGIGFTMMPAFSSAYSGLAHHQIGRATAMTNTLQRIFSSLGIALLATVLAAQVAASVPARMAPTPAALSRAFDATFWVALATLLLALPAALTLRRPVAEGGRPDRAPRGLTPLAAVIAGLGFTASLLIAAGDLHPATPWAGW